MDEHLQILESAISDVGYWSWWSGNLPESVQIEFGGVQLWNPPSAKGKAPSGQIALRFCKPRIVAFLSLTQKLPAKWPDLLAADKLEPFAIDRGEFSLTDPAACARLVARAKRFQALVGSRKAVVPRVGEAFLALTAHGAGLIVISESMSTVSHKGEVDPKTIAASHERWWRYWAQYWKRRDKRRPMPKDYACEVTIPGGEL